jgi:hypothetical protein
MDACQIDWRALAQFATACVLFVGLIYTTRQLRLARRTRDAEDRNKISQRIDDHNALILDDERARSTVVCLEGLNIPTNEAEAHIYWTFRGVHLRHHNLIWSVWELAGTPGPKKELNPGYEGWQRFDREAVAKKLRATALANGKEANKPENKAGADLWNGMSKYEAVPTKFFLWLQWLADSEENE